MPNPQELRRPLGIYNTYNDCWLISLFQCLVWSKHYCSLLLNNSSKDDLWNVYLSTYRSMMHKDNLPNWSEYKKPKLSKETIDIHALRCSWYDNETSQQDVRQALEMLMMRIPDRKVEYCRRHAPITSRRVVIMGSTGQSNDIVLAKCKVCEKVIASHGYDPEKTLQGRTIRYLENPIVLSEFNTEQDKKRFSLVHYRPCDNKAYQISSDENTVLSLTMPITKELVDFTDLLKNFALIHQKDLPPEMRCENLRAIDSYGRVCSYEIEVQQHELYIDEASRRLPIEIIVSLDRIKIWRDRMIKVQTPVDVKLQVNLQVLFCDAQSLYHEFKPDDFTYDLASFVVHKGVHVSSGHYVAYVCHSKPGLPNDQQNWSLCDDDKITPVDVEQVQHAARNAYLLFFRLHQSKML